MKSPEYNPSANFPITLRHFAVFEEEMKGRGGGDEDEIRWKKKQGTGEEEERGEEIQPEGGEEE